MVSFVNLSFRPIVFRFLKFFFYAQIFNTEVGWGPVGHAVVTKLLAKSAGALKITVVSEESYPAYNRVTGSRHCLGCPEDFTVILTTFWSKH